MDTPEITEEILQCFDEQGHPTQGLPRSTVLQHPHLYRCGVSNIWLVNNQGQLLCSKRTEDKKVNPGRWQSYFGGHVPAGMSFKENAIKELQEETGIAATESELFLIDKGLYLKEGNNKFYENFAFLYNQGTLDLTKSDGEVTEVRWMNMKDYWQEQEANPDKWCHKCRPEDQEKIMNWLKQKIS